VLILAPEAYLPLRAIGANYHASAEGLAAADEVCTVLDTPAPVPGTAAVPDGAELTFDGVEVEYPGREAVALRLDTTVRPGEIVAFTGPSGCGKSTALAALLGFVTPTRGRILIGDLPLTGIDPRAWRRRIAWVPQRPQLFAGSIRANVTLGDPDAGTARVRRALADAGALDFVDALPHGLDTTVSDGGVGLSAGQRQRIALARAFLRDAPIVVLDEPTANLDAEAAAGVMAAIRRLVRGRTVLLAAHRPELIALAGRVVSLAPVGAQ
jgi:ABC-type transport system involved in cytochrome bd biosynthesis fused ATPase/permease subunit